MTSASLQQHRFQKQPRRSDKVYGGVAFPGDLLGLATGEVWPLGALPDRLLGIARTVSGMTGSDFILPARLSEATLYVLRRR